MYNIGRSDRIRTCGLLVPNQAHYQTVPHPDVVSFDILLTCAIGEGTEPPNAAFAAEASHLPCCATPREKFTLNFCYLVRLVRGPNRFAQCEEELLNL